MVTYEILDDPKIVVLKISGNERFEDFEDLGQKFWSDVKERGLRGLLVDCSEFHGWESKVPPAVMFLGWLEGQKQFGKIAILFHEGVRDEADNLAEFLRNTARDIRLFYSEHYDAALDWIAA